MQRKTITVIGATGNVGKLVVSEALAHGYKVRAYIHHTPLSLQHPHLVEITSSIADAVTGADVVISTVSNWKARRQVLTDTMNTLIAAKARRIISVTGADALAPQEQAPIINRLTRPLLMLVARAVLEDGEEHIRVLSKSSIPWIVVRSPLMTPFAAKPYELIKGVIPPYITVPRKSVVNAILDLVETDAQGVMSIRT